MVLVSPNADKGICNLHPSDWRSAEQPLAADSRSSHFHLRQVRTAISTLSAPTLNANSRSALNGRKTVEPSCFSEKGITAEPISLCDPTATKIVRSPVFSADRYSTINSLFDRETTIDVPSEPEIVSLAKEEGAATAIITATVGSDNR